MSRSLTYAGFLFCLAGFAGAAHKPAAEAHSPERTAVASSRPQAVPLQTRTGQTASVRRTDSGRIAIATREFDLKSLGASDFGDGEPAER